MPGEWWDKSWGVVEGCTPVSRGCDHCWARVMLKRFGQNPHEVRTFPERLDQPLRWRKPHRVFVAPRGDLFHRDVPDEFIEQAFIVMARAEPHTFLVLSKRPQRMLPFLSNPFTRNFIMNRAMAENVAGHRKRGWQGPMPFDYPAWPLPNVYLGVSVENQETADERIPILLNTPAAKRWVSAEPLLGEIDIWDDCLAPNIPEHGVLPHNRPDWIVTAPESGPGRRYCDLDWVRSLRDQCETANVPFMLKHLYLGTSRRKAKVSLPLLDGRRHEDGL